MCLAGLAGGFLLVHPLRTLEEGARGTGAGEPGRQRQAALRPAPLPARAHPALARCSS